MKRQCHIQPSPKDVVFHWIILYDWNLHNPTPFMIDLKEHFTDSIPESWYRKKWESKHRHQKVKFRIFPERTMSVFCKVEKGNFCKNI